MGLAVARKCTRHLYLLLGVVMVTATLMFVYHNNEESGAQQDAFHQGILPQLRILSLKRSLYGGKTTAPPTKDDVAVGKNDHDEDGAVGHDYGGTNKDGKEDDYHDDDKEEEEDLVIKYGGKDKSDNVPAPRVDDGATSISDKEQIRLNMEDIVLNEERVHKKSVQKVIILTYMRSGSTMTGDLFQQHPDVFYVFEPLWRLQKFYCNQSQVISYLNGNAIRETFPADDFWTQNSMSTQTLKDMLSCKLRDLDIDTLRAGHLATSKSTQIYSRCLFYHPMRRSVQAVKDCFPLLQTPCSKAKVTVVKTIRYTVGQLEQLLNTDPEVKVIHLIRDPRGTLYSQARVGEFKWANRELAFSKLCRRMMNDLDKVYYISKLYPNRILMVRYEDIVQYPIASAKYMYDFVGLKMTEEIKSYIWNITYAGSVDKTCHSLCTMRANSTNTAYRWRRVVSYKDVEMMDQHCSEVYRHMGYRHFISLHQYRNHNYSSRFNEFGQHMNYAKVMTLKQLEAMPESENAMYQNEPEHENVDPQIVQESKNVDPQIVQESKNVDPQIVQESKNVHPQIVQESKNVDFQKEPESRNSNADNKRREDNMIKKFQVVMERAIPQRPAH